MSSSFLETSCRRECEQIVWFFDFTISSIVSIPAIEKLAGIPDDTLKNLLITHASIQEPKQVASIVRILSIIGYKPRWDWDYILKTDLPT